MGLDIYLHAASAFATTGRSGIFIREAGRQREITREEWDRLQPGREPAVACVPEQTTVLFHAHITHNLGAMAAAAGIYAEVWRPEEAGIKKGEDLILPITQALMRLYGEPELYKRHNPENGWGSYETFCGFLEEYLAACYRYKEARIEASQ